MGTMATPPLPTVRTATGMGPRMSEDWVAVCLGLLVFGLSLGLLAGTDVLGWVVTTRTWTPPGAALAAGSKAYASWPGLASLLATYLFVLTIPLIGARLLGANLRRFAPSFSWVGLLISYVFFHGMLPPLVRG
jgi:hypothetical protein